jgi:hypothetical protein
MHKSIFSLALLAPLVGACGASFPPPTQHMVDAQSAQRGALEVGANSEPRAQLSLKLAEEQIAQARVAMTDGDNERADGLLLRAKADAELAIAQARDKGAKIAGQKAVEESTEQKATNAEQGATK